MPLAQISSLSLDHKDNYHEANLLKTAFLINYQLRLSISQCFLFPQMASLWTNF